MLYSYVNAKNPNLSDIVAGLKLLCEPGEIYELRCPKTSNDGTVSGYFDDLTKLAHHADCWAGIAPAVYITLNPAKRDLLARAANRIQRRAGVTTADHEVTRRTRLLLDFDPVRPAGISSTQEEHAVALDRARKCKDWLATQGLPEPILADSGNGGHLLYGLDLPNDEPSRLLVENFLKAVAKRFSDSEVNLDVSVFNAARISKVYGTLACKGDNIPERPHRLSRILEAPSCLSPVPQEILAGIANLIIPSCGGLDWPLLRSEAKRLEGNGGRDTTVWVEVFLGKHAVGVRQSKNGNSKWLRRWVLERCPFCKSEDTAAALTVSENGKIGFRCQHNRCSEPRKRWTDFRRHFEPDWMPGKKVKAKESFADVLVRLAKEHCELWHTPSQAAYATYRDANYAIESTAFKRVIHKLHYDDAHKACSENAVKDAALHLAAVAIYEGKEYQTYRRVARIADKLFIDLCNESWECVEIDERGWKIGKSPIKFVRSENAAPLPKPVPGGDLQALRKFVNLSDSDFKLFIGSLLDALKGFGPYFVNIATGEQGSAKSTLCRIAVRLIDPALVAELATAPKDTQALATDAANSHLLAYDNVSRLSLESSDAFCRLATGGGFKNRKLYTNGEQFVSPALCPLWLNGIEDFATQPDLLSRSVALWALQIEESKRLDERRFWAEFEAIQSGILGALYSAVSVGMRNEKTVTLESLPRMADSARWIAACCPSLGWSYEEWLTAYTEKQQEAEDTALENDVVGMALWSWWKARSEKIWQGSASDLRLELFGYALDEKSFPRQSNVFSGRLRRLLPVLRKKGVTVEKSHTRSGSKITVQKVMVCDDVTMCDDQAKGRSSHKNPANYRICDDVTMCDDLFPAFMKEKMERRATIPKDNKEFPEKDRHTSSQCVSSSKNQGLSVTIAENPYRHTPSRSVTQSSHRQTTSGTESGRNPAGPSLRSGPSKCHDEGDDV
jgi:hypothetical protein